jgi:DNA-binding transcriptional LysR family regulator
MADSDVYWLVNTDLRGVSPLNANRRLLCASPAYLARAGAPHTPQELARHNVISIRRLTRRWTCCT